MGFFDSETYLLVMYVAISLVSLLILFNFVNIFQGPEFIFEDKVIKITGLVAEEQELEDLSKAYFVYYSIITILGFFILLTVIRFFRVLKEG